MMISLHTTLLLSVAWALFIFSETKVCCMSVVVQSSSEFGTFCNGLHCPPGSNCMTFTSVINGNKTYDNRCTNMYGEVVRQETVNISNGEMCIKNLTMMGKEVNVEHSCRKLSKAGTDYMEEKNNHKIKEAVLTALEEEQDAIEDAIESARIHEKVGKLNKHITEVINRANVLAQEAEARAELLEKLQEGKLAEMERLLEAQLDRHLIY